MNKPCGHFKHPRLRSTKYIFLYFYSRLQKIYFPAKEPIQRDSRRLIKLNDEKIYIQTIDKRQRLGFVTPSPRLEGTRGWDSCNLASAFCLMSVPYRDRLKVLVRGLVKFVPALA